MLDYLTIVSLRSHFAETNLIFLSLSQFADKVCKLKEGDFPILFYLKKRKPAESYLQVFLLPLLFLFGRDNDLSVCALADGTGGYTCDILTCRMDYTAFISIHRL